MTETILSVFLLAVLCSEQAGVVMTHARGGAVSVGPRGGSPSVGVGSLTLILGYKMAACCPPGSLPFLEATYEAKGTVITVDGGYELCARR